MKPFVSLSQCGFRVCLKTIVVALKAFTLPIAVTPLVAADLSSSYTWNPVEIGGGGLVTGIVNHPLSASIRYVRTDVGGAEQRKASGTVRG